MFWHRLQLLTKEIPSPVEEVQRDDEPFFDEEIDTSFDQQLATDENEVPTTMWKTLKNRRNLHKPHPFRKARCKKSPL